MPDDKDALDTRKRIITFLRQNQTATVPGLSKLWGLSRRDIRYHIHKLIQDGIIEPISEPEKDHHLQRGRPIITYRLNSSTDDNNFKRLCHHLLAYIFESADQLFIEESLKKLSAIFVDELNTPLGITSSQINRAIQFLNENFYRARWEASRAGPRILFHNCPYAAILAKNPGLCRMDKYILEQLLGRSVAQTNKINLKNEKPGSCEFIISFSPGKILEP
jgi:predicted ArsR family transcriptional regulator